MLAAPFRARPGRSAIRRPRDVVYEESLGLDEDAAGSNNFRLLDAVALGWVGWARPAAPVRRAAKAAAAKIAVATPSYSVADAATGAIVATGAAAAVMASTRRSADTIAVADFELRKVG